MSIIDEVKKLNLPEGEYAVVGSGIMEALGIREARDIDLGVSEKLYLKLKKRGWEEREGHLVRGGISASCELAGGAYPRSIAQVIASAEIIDGIPFMNLRELMAFKMTLSRDKDREDIKLIVSYLSKEK